MREIVNKKRKQQRREGGQLVDGKWSANLLVVRLFVCCACAWSAQSNSPKPMSSSLDSALASSFFAAGAAAAGAAAAAKNSDDCIYQKVIFRWRARFAQFPNWGKSWNGATRKINSFHAVHKKLQARKKNIRFHSHLQVWEYTLQGNSSNVNS